MSLSVSDASSAPYEKPRKEKLSDDDVIAICELLNEGTITTSEIANRFHVSQAMISCLKSGERRKDITSKYLKLKKGIIKRSPKKSKPSTMKLTEADVLTICNLLNDGRLSVHDIAERYDVSQATISNIRSGRTWGNITGGLLATSRLPRSRSAKMTGHDVVAICERLNAGDTSVDILAERYGVKVKTIVKIRDGVTWRYITTQHLHSAENGDSL